MRPFLPFATLLGAAFLLGCQEQASGPVGLEGLDPQLKVVCDNVRPDHPQCQPPPPPSDDAETFNVTIMTCFALHATVPGGPCLTPGPVWTPVPQTVQAKSGNWLHIWDSGGNGTRGRPKYPGAFNTKIFLQPVETASIASCAGDMGNPSLSGKLNQISSLSRVFDFQVGYDIADNPTGFHFFLFRWEDNDGTFSASTGFGSSGSDEHTSIDFLGDNNPNPGNAFTPDDITDATIPRVFRITGAKVIAQELDKNKVIRMFECPNDHIIEVTVTPVT